MAIAARLKRLFDDFHVPYRVFNHRPRLSLWEITEYLKINPNQLLNTEVLADSLGTIIAVMPINRAINFIALRNRLHRNVKLLPHCKANRFFSDCEPGVHPPFGEPYGLQTLVDSSIREVDVLYFRAGSFNAILEIATDDFLYLNADAICLNFGKCQEEPKVQPRAPKEYVLDNKDYWLKAKIFPQMPPIAHKLLDLSFKNKKSVSELSKELAADKNFHTDLISYAKASLNNRTEEENTAALPGLQGFDMVSHIALGVSVKNAFANDSNRSHNRQFWLHSLYCANLSEQIAKIIVDIEVEPYISHAAGLLHNLGLLLFSELFPPEFRLLWKWMRLNPLVPIELLEKRLLGMGHALHALGAGHAKMGEWLLNHWQMPEVICIVAREHHNLRYNDKYAAYVHIVQLANKILRNYKIGDGQPGTINQESLESLGIKLSQVEEIIVNIKARSQDFDHMVDCIVTK